MSLTKYQKISKIMIKDFRNLGGVELDFTKSPIITLVGDNEAGKTSVVKAFMTAALHDSPRDQKDYIRDGQKSFGVAIYFEDGTMLMRLKENGGLNMYRITYPDKTVWDTTKLTEGLPKQVQDLMGLVAEPETGAYLNVRTYEDQLLFVSTKASENYKVMYNALKVGQLNEAFKLGSSEVNTLRSEINKNNSAISTLNEQCRSIPIVDVEPLVVVKNRLKEQIAVLDKMTKLRELIHRENEIQNKIGALALIDMYALQPISESTTIRLNNINRLMEQKSDLVRKQLIYSELGNIGEIDVSILTKLNNLSEKISLLDSLKSKAVALEPVNNLEQISESTVMHMNRVTSLIESKSEVDKKLSAIDISQCKEIDNSEINRLSKFERAIEFISQNKQRYEAIKQCETYINQLQDYIKSCGVAFETCPKCGEDVVFDLDKMQ